MKPLHLCLLIASLATVRAESLPPVTQPESWHATSLPQALGYMLLFSLIGIVTAVFGYLIFDKCTPGDLHREIVEHKNVAAAIIGAAVILGICLIVAASIMG